MRADRDSDLHMVLCEPQHQPQRSNAIHTRHSPKPRQIAAVFKHGLTLSSSVPWILARCLAIVNSGGPGGLCGGERMKRERNYEKVNPIYINANTFIFKSEEARRERERVEN